MLYVPFRLLLTENGNGTRIDYDLPSGLIAEGREIPELTEAAKKLDARVAALVEKLVS